MTLNQFFKVERNHIKKDLEFINKQIDRHIVKGLKIPVKLKAEHARLVNELTAF